MNMKENIPISEFSPANFFKWLIQRWDDPEGITAASVNALKELLGQESPDRYSIHCLDFERLVSIIANEDLMNFVEYQLEQSRWQHSANDENISVRHQIGFDKLTYKSATINPSLFKAILIKFFNRDLIYPSQGMFQILREVTEWVGEAESAFKDVSESTDAIIYHKLSDIIHSKVDACLLALERYLELLIEFLATVSKTFCGLGDQQWTKVMELNSATWWEKEKKIVYICDYISKNSDSYANYQIPKKDDLLKLINLMKGCMQECQEQHCKRNRPTGKECNCNNAGTYLQQLSNLRKVRNDLSHTSNTLLNGTKLPSSYEKSVKSMLEYLKEMLKESNGLHPTIINLVSTQQDIYGRIELLLAHESRRLITARFSSLSETTSINSRTIASDLGCEFFLFPSLPDYANDIREPILVKREAHKASEDVPHFEYEFTVTDLNSQMQEVEITEDVR